MVPRTMGGHAYTSWARTVSIQHIHIVDVRIHEAWAQAWTMGVASKVMDKSIPVSRGTIVNKTYGIPKNLPVHI